MKSDLKSIKWYLKPTYLPMYLYDTSDSSDIGTVVTVVTNKFCLNFYFLTKKKIRMFCAILKFCEIFLQFNFLLCFSLSFAI